MGEWDESRRNQARQRMWQVKPWTKSTGPRTPQGKRKSRLNYWPIASREAMEALIDCEAELEALESIDLEELANPNSEAAQLVDRILAEFIAGT